MFFFLIDIPILNLLPHTIPVQTITHLTCSSFIVHIIIFYCYLVKHYKTLILYSDSISFVFIDLSNSLKCPEKISCSSDYQ